MATCVCLWAAIGKIVSRLSCWALSAACVAVCECVLSWDQTLLFSNHPPSYFVILPFSSQHRISAGSEMLSSSGSF